MPISGENLLLFELSILLLLFLVVLYKVLFGVKVLGNLVHCFVDSDLF